MSPVLDHDTKQAILRRAYAIAADYIDRPREEAIRGLAVRLARVEILGKEKAEEITRLETVVGR